MGLSFDIDLGYDLVIVGAGPAGCTLAKNISEQYKVLLIDYSVFPRHKTCSGILVSESQDFLRDELPEKVFVSPTTLDIEYVDVDNKTNRVSKKGFLNSNRFLFDKFIFNEIKAKKNVTFIDKARLIEFNEAQDREHLVLLIEVGGVVKSIVSKYLVGCDGALSGVRKKISNREISFYVGVKEYLKSSKKIDKAYFIFDSEITDFYSWIIPKGQYVEVGSLLVPIDAKNRFDVLKKKVESTFGIGGEGKIESAVVLRPSSIKDIILGKKNVLLCGEAAGLISPSSAEGISFALKSGKYCAEAFNSGEKDVLKKYNELARPLLTRINEKLKKSEIISNKSLRKKGFS